MTHAEALPAREGSLTEEREVGPGEAVEFPERRLSYGSWLGTVPARCLHVRGHPTSPAITAPVRSPAGITRLLNVRIDARGVAYDVPPACVRPPATPLDHDRCGDATSDSDPDASSAAAEIERAAAADGAADRSSGRHLSVLIATPGEAGHIARLSRLAGALLDRGHRVRVLTEEHAVGRLPPRAQWIDA